MPRDHLIVQIIKHSTGYFQRTHPDLAKSYNTHAAPYLPLCVIIGLLSYIYGRCVYPLSYNASIRDAWSFDLFNFDLIAFIFAFSIITLIVIASDKVIRSKKWSLKYGVRQHAKESTISNCIGLISKLAALIFPMAFILYAASIYFCFAETVFKFTILLILSLIVLGSLSSNTQTVNYNASLIASFFFYSYIFYHGLNFCFDFLSLVIFKIISMILATVLIYSILFLLSDSDRIQTLTKRTNIAIMIPTMLGLTAPVLIAQLLQLTHSGGAIPIIISYENQTEAFKALLIMDCNDRFIAFDPTTKNSATYSKHKTRWVMQKPDLNSKSNNATIENNEGG